MKPIGNSGSIAFVSLVIVATIAAIAFWSDDPLQTRFPDGGNLNTYHKFVGPGDSMEPLLHSGYKLTLVWDWKGIEPGYIVIDRTKVHRAEYIHYNEDGTPRWVITKGINNPYPDRKILLKRNYMGTVVSYEKR